MYENKKKFINECTYNGYIKSKKYKSKEFKILTLQLVLFIILIPAITFVINSDFLRKYGIIIAYLDIAAYLVYLTKINRAIIIRLRNDKFGLKRHQYINENVREYFRNNENKLMDSIFLNKDGKVNSEKIDFYIEWIKENEQAHKYDGIFEKALLAGVFIPIWNKIVDISITLINTTSEEKLTNDILVLGLLVFMLIFIIMMLKNTLAIIYLDIQNVERNEYRLFRNAILRYKEKYKFGDNVSILIED